MPALIRSSALRGFAELVSELGGEPEPMLRQLNLRAADILAGSGVIPYSSVVQVLELAAESLGCQDFGLRLAQRQGLDILGPVAVIVQNSETALEALQAVQRYIRFYSPAIEFSLEPAGPDSVQLAFDIAMPRNARRRQTTELSLGLACRIVALLTGLRDPPEAILFRHAAALPRATYRRFFGTRIEFGQDRDALQVSRSLLGRRIDKADPQLRQVVAEYLEQSEALHPLELVEQVASLVDRLLPTLRCGLGAVARQLGLHERTLQRRLAADGIVFEQIVDQVRRDRALELLAERRMPMSQVAGMLGYREQASFNRACRRWFGSTPGAQRRNS